MKNVLVLCAMLLLFADCSDEKNQPQFDDRKLLTRSVGMKIPSDVAERWKSRYEKSGTASRSESFSVSSQSVFSLLPSLDEKVGVVLHHATDLQGKHHLLLIPIGEDLNLWTGQPVLDASGDMFVDENTARSWTSTYKQQNAAGPWSHFFGASVFEQILSTPGLSSIDIVPATNDEGVPQLLMYAWDSIADGRKMDAAAIYDFSTICPTACPNLN
jgi:hypothetical protein